MSDYIWLYYTKETNLPERPKLRRIIIYTTDAKSQAGISLSIKSSKRIQYGNGTTSILVYKSRGRILSVGPCQFVSGWG